MTDIAPWLSVADAAEAVAFYRAAFGAVDMERGEDPDGVLQVAQLWIGAANFWIQHEPGASRDENDIRPVRTILAVDDPDPVFARAVAAGATVVNGMYEGHGWRICRIADPFGHHWEIGRRLEA